MQDPMIASMDPEMETAVTFETEIRAPVEQVFALIADQVEFSEKTGSMPKKKVTSGSIGVGTAWDTVNPFRRYTSTIVGYEESKEIMRRLTGHYEGWIKEEFQAVAPGWTLVKSSLHLLRNGKVLSAELSRFHEKCLQQVRRHLEREYQVDLLARDEAFIEENWNRIRVPETDGPDMAGPCRGGLNELIGSEGNSGTSHRSAFRKFWSGPVDLLVTFLYGSPFALSNVGAQHLLEQSKSVFSSASMRVFLTYPQVGRELPFWKATTEILGGIPRKDKCNNVWEPDELYLLLTYWGPEAGKGDYPPILSFRLGDINAKEADVLLFSIVRATSPSRFPAFLMPSVSGGRLARPEGHFKDLFQEKLPEASRISVPVERRATNALDILSLPMVWIPGLQVDLINFSGGIKREFNQACGETVFSKAGAVPFRTVIKDRLDFRPFTLRGESGVRQAWN